MFDLDTVLRWFFTIVYFSLFLKIMDWIFYYSSISISLASLLTVICCFWAFIISAILADFTVKKIERYYRRK